MMACARAASRKERVLYIDTSNAFTANRIVAMLKAIPHATAVGSFCFNYWLILSFLSQLTDKKNT